MLAAVLAACAPPDRGLRQTLTLPETALAWLEPDTARSRELHPGVAYRFLWSRRGPWAVHLVQARVEGRCELGFEVLRARERELGGMGRERVSSMVARARSSGRGAGVLAAVNADFFTPEGDAVGPEVVEGRVLHAVARPAFAWRPGSDPWMGQATVSEAGWYAGWRVPSDGGDGETEGVGGFPDLIDAGRRVGDLEVGARPSFAAARHPRTAVGYDVDRGELWLVVVDGRQPPHSAGMTLPELADLFEALGAEEALNLDGGGSSALIVGSAPVNRPSDATGERAVVNALALTREGGRCSR